MAAFLAQAVKGKRWPQYWGLMMEASTNGQVVMLLVLDAEAAIIARRGAAVLSA